MFIISISFIYNWLTDGKRTRNPPENHAFESVVSAQKESFSFLTSQQLLAYKVQGKVRVSSGKCVLYRDNFTFAAGKKKQKNSGGRGGRSFSAANLSLSLTCVTLTRQGKLDTVDQITTD